MRFLCLFLLLPILSFSQKSTPAELSRYEVQAKRVTIIRDNWGIPHIYGKTDADAVFGLLYAQCEENFSKVEENNLEMMGRLSEIKGEAQVYSDLQMRMIYDQDAARQDFQKSPEWLKKLMIAAADGVNYYLFKHPEVRPAVLNHFEPWFALLRTNGSISATQLGGITVADMRNLYPAKTGTLSFNDRSMRNSEDDAVGSNGFAIGPSKSATKNALLYINPHVTFYFRSEVQMVSEEGLNAYGAVTWGTFFIFQGFNETCGWMHTSGITDVADLFTETVVKNNQGIFTKYDATQKPVSTKEITIRYKLENEFREYKFTTYKSFHGPVMGSRDGNWLSLREGNRSLNALIQSWQRTKCKSFEDFKKNMDLRANSSDNTVFADNKGNIAYWHGNFIPKRNKDLDYSKPVDGSVSSTDWQELHKLDETVHVYNPTSGFIQNCNSNPFTSSAESGPNPANYPLYMAPDGENFRGINAAKLLKNANDLTLDRLISEIGYDRHLAAFDVIIPTLLKDFESLAQTDTLRSNLAEPIHYLKAWNRNVSDTSIAAAIAIEFGYRLQTLAPRAANSYKASHAVAQMEATLASTNSRERLNNLQMAINSIVVRFGTWKTPWGTMNRYQRVASGMFNDDKLPSLPVGLAASSFGALPSFTSARSTQLNKRYGYNGNSFVASVEFGKKVKAKSIVTGGQSFDPNSKHFNDQAQMFIDGKFKDVLFYKEDVMKHIERQYHPGE